MHWISTKKRKKDMNHMTADVSWAPWNEERRRMDKNLKLKFTFDCTADTSVETDLYDDEEGFEYARFEEKEGLIPYHPETMMQDLSAYLKREIESCNSEDMRKDLRRKLYEVEKFEFKIIEVEMEGME